jgi:hypothetical protein
MSNASDAIIIDETLRSTVRRLRAELDREKVVTAEAIRALEQERAACAGYRQALEPVVNACEKFKPSPGLEDIWEFYPLLIWAEILKIREAYANPAGRELAERVKGRDEKLKAYLKSKLSDPNNYDSYELTFPPSWATREQQIELESWLNRLLNHTANMAAGVVDDIDEYADLEVSE